MISVILGALGKVLPALSAAGRWVWANRKATFPILLPALALVVLLSWFAWREHQRAATAEADQRADVQRQRREEELRRMGYPVAFLAQRQADADASARRLNEDLRAQLAAAQKVVGPLRTRLAAALRGQAAPVDAPPREDAPGDEARPVVLRQGDVLALGADLHLGEERSGALVIQGNLFADAADGRRLATQRFEQESTWATVPQQRCPAAAAHRRWHVGGAGSLGTGGPMAGGGGTYRVNVFGWEPEVMGVVEGRQGGARVTLGFFF